MSSRPGLLEWALANLRIGAISFGGSGRALLYHDLAVTQRGWLSEDEFYETLTLAQALPGPNIVNLVAYMGYGFAGPAGAALGVLGLCLPGAVLAVLGFALVPFEHPALRDLFQGFALGSAVLFLVFVGRMAKNVAEATPLTGRGLRDPLVWRLALAGGVAVASVAGLPLWWIVAGGLGIGMAIEVFARS